MKNIFFRLLFIILGAFIGGVIVSIKDGDFPLEVFSGFIVGGGVILLLVLFSVYRKNDKTPDVDERVITNIKNFLNYSLLIALTLLSIMVFSFDLFDYESIPIIYLYIYLTIVCLIVGIGGYIIKKR